MWQELAAPSAVKLQRALRLSSPLEKESVVISLLLIWGVLVYYQHLGTALGDTEAIYTSVARRIVRTHEWFPLVYEGQPYLNKPPLHFWLMALSILLWGPGEFAARFPSATFGIATMLLVYYSGKAVFHRQVGLIAALIMTTTFSAIWDAHRGMMEVEVGFWINLAFFAFYLAYRGGGRRIGYICLAFAAIAVGTMLKGLVGLLLPGSAALAYVVMTRRSKVMRELPVLGAGLASCALITGSYYWTLGEPFNRHFFVVENLTRILHGSNSPFLYLYVIFADFFPWSLFLMSVSIYLWTRRSRPLSEEDRLVRLWPVSFFLLLNVPAGKAERFLVYMIPPFALLMARYWDHLFSSRTKRLQVAEVCLLRLAAAIFGLVSVLGLFLGPLLIRTRFRIPVDFLPLAFKLLIGSGCVALWYAARGWHPRAIFSSVLGVALAMTFGLVLLFYPALARYDSAIPISQQVRAIVGDSPLVIYHPGRPFKEEILYYLDLPYPVPQFKTAEEVHAALRSGRRVFGLLAKDRLKEIEWGDGVPLVQLGNYSYRKWRYVLVSNRDQS